MIGIKNRKNYLKEARPEYPITFTYSCPESPIVFVEEKPLSISGIRENYYFINNCGDIRNIYSDTIHPRLINSGYLSATLLSSDPNKKYTQILLHRAVKMTFDPIEEPEKYTVNHSDMDPFNNYDYNLEWMTQKENNDEKCKNNPHSGCRNYQAKFDYIQLKLIVNELTKGTKYKDILQMLGMEDTWNNRDYIGNIKRGITYKNEVQRILNE